jgi:Zn-dependent protease with chaperone function
MRYLFRSVSAPTEMVMDCAMAESEKNAVAAPMTPDERESFFAAIARHRRAARRVQWISQVCASLLALIVALLTAPLWYAVLGLAFDLVNFVVPTPDLIKLTTDLVFGLTDDPTSVSVGRWAFLTLMAALPGLILMSALMHTLSRVMKEALTSDAAMFIAHSPDVRSLNEQQFSNVVSEMAIAASLAPPRVLVSETDAVNAAAFGADDAQTTLVVSRGLLDSSSRAELQGVAAHLVGSIANGDLRIGTGIATLLSAFGIITALSRSFGDRQVATRLATLLRASLRFGSTKDDGELALMLANPFADADANRPASSTEELGSVSVVHPDSESAIYKGDKIPWRTLAWMPIVGPLVIAGFFGGVLCRLLLQPLLALSWRSRKYMADATAVRLTRDPETLASALQKIRGQPTASAFAAWLTHLTVVPTRLIGAKSLFGNGVLMTPSLDRRLKALGVLGAQVAVRSHRYLPLWAWLALLPISVLLIALMGFALYLLVLVSVAMSGLFTWLPAILLHALLR